MRPPCYPSEHKKLMDCIIEKGLLLSEYPPGIRPSRYTFPRRNRLISAWAERIIVLYEGEVVADGTKNEVFGNDKIIDLVGIRPPEIFTMGKMLDEEAMCYTVTDFVHAFC